MPSPPLQRRIAAILSAYDDLIENNTRRIKILEEMAQLALPRVVRRLPLPGHESVPLVDSPLGKIPEGWDVALVNLSQIEIGADLEHVTHRRGDYDLDYHK